MEPRLPPPASKEKFKDQRSGLTLVSHPGKNCQVNGEVYIFCKLDRRDDVRHMGSERFMSYI